jgi:hypothetical protein
MIRIVIRLSLELNKQKEEKRMKKIIISILFVMLTGCAALYQIPTEIPVDTSFVPVINTSGCIGQPLDVCINTMLSQNKALYLNKEGIKKDVNRQLEKLKEVDVNGKLISDKRSIIIVSNRYFYIEEHITRIIDNGYTVCRWVEYDSNNIVTKITISWNDHFITSSNTLEEYDNTPLYTELQMILGKDCPDKITVYKFFQNTVKPKMENYEKHTEYQWDNIKETKKEGSSPIPFAKYYTFIYEEKTENTLDSSYPYFGSTIIITRE